MFGSAILDVLIGLITIFLLLSLTATAIREAFETLFKARAVMLERGIRELLDDPTESGLVRRLYEHPLVFGLYKGAYDPKEVRRHGGDLPTYIPTKNFSGALLDIAIRGQRAGPYATEHSEPIFTTEELRRAVRRLPSPKLRHALITAIDDARGDLDKVRANLEAWFDSSMDRVSGWYKRRTQMWLFVIGAVLATSLNVNAITIANHLWADKAAREALVRQAEQIQSDTTIRQTLRDTTAASAERRARSSMSDLESLNLPIGWDHLPPRGPTTNTFDYVFQIVVGILVTALAVTLGAPFWFDALNKIMVIRSTVKPHEKSPEEGSEDRRDPTALRVTLNGQPPTSAPVSAPSAASSPGSAAATAPFVGAPAPAFEAHEWASGHPDEGIL
jgi:hypothetical protein